MMLVPCHDPSRNDIAEAMPHIEHALEHLEGWDIAGVLMAIFDERVLLIHCMDDAGVIGAGVVNVETDMGGTRALIVHLFGAETGTSWEATFVDLRAFARTMGCNKVRGYGRAGWARKLGARQTYGWEATA